jgi:hypothetical protein
MAQAHEDQLTLGELAAYHIGLFLGTAARINASPAFLAHALFVLIEQAQERRREWLPINDDGTMP